MISYQETVKLFAELVSYAIKVTYTSKTSTSERQKCAMLEDIITETQKRLRE